MKTEPTRNILVPIDFSEMSIQAIETAKRLAAPSGATIHLAHIHVPQYPAGFMGPVFSTGRPPIAFEDYRMEALAKELKEIARRGGLSSDKTHLREGAPAFDQICRIAAEIPADLVVMPTHGRTGLKHVFLGSTAERVVQHSPCPVFVVRERKEGSKEERITIKTILVPVDFSDCSMEALNYSIALAEQTGASLIVFHALYLGYTYTTDGYAMYDFSAMEKAMRESAEQQMREFTSSANFRGVKFETVVKMGWPVEEITNAAKDGNVDLIVTGTHGWTGFKHVLIGSTAEHVVRNAPCSVIVVPSHRAIRLANLFQESASKRPEKPSKTQQKNSNVFNAPGKPSRKERKLASHPFPERRKTNKFREAHVHNGE